MPGENTFLRKHRKGFPPHGQHWYRMYQAANRSGSFSALQSYVSMKPIAGKVIKQLRSRVQYKLTSRSRTMQHKNANLSSPAIKVSHDRDRL
jgi:hypothetical protein